MGCGYSKKNERPVAIPIVGSQQRPDRPSRSSQNLPSQLSLCAASSSSSANPVNPCPASRSSSKTSTSSTSGYSRHSEGHFSNSGVDVSPKRAAGGSSKRAATESSKKSPEGGRMVIRGTGTLEFDGQQGSKLTTPDAQGPDHGENLERQKRQETAAASNPSQERGYIGTSASRIQGRNRPRHIQEPKVARSHAKDEYTVGWICALPGEMAASEAMLDEIHGSLQDPDPRDNNTYTLGQIREHNVVIASLPAGNYGTNPAATVARDMLRTFRSLRIGLLVGIGGGVPSPAHDVRLGDVVVSQPTGDSGGVIQFDRGKTTGKGQFQRTGVLPPPPQLLLTALSRIQARHKREDSHIPSLLINMTKKFPKMRDTYIHPGAVMDRLCEITYDHPAGKPCQFCCNSGYVFARKPRDNEKPTIHYGNIASSNQVMRHGATRDRLGKELNVLCFEMEAAGLMFHFPCLVIRGICDYSDSHKNKVWQDYAAATAAAFAKELLFGIPAYQVRKESPIKILGEPCNVYWMVTRPLNSLFIGRHHSLKMVEHAILSSLEVKDTSLPRCYVITGIGGQGKSELCLKVVNRLRSRFWGTFWVDASTVTTAESGFVDIAKKVGAFAETLQDARLALANLRHRWVLVLDNADNPHVDYQQYLPASGFGTVLLTSRNRECKRYGTIGSHLLEGLDQDNAKRLLCKAAEIPHEQMIEHEDDALHIADLLGYHPLALIQAGAYVARGHCTLSRYPDIFEHQRRRLLQFCSTQAQARYGHVYATFEASAQVLESSEQEAAKDALDMLSMMSMISHRALPLSIFEAAFRGARRTVATDAKEKDELDCLSSWHVARLPALMLPGSDTWDSFRMVEACHLLKTLSLISTEKDSGTIIMVMHPLTHVWVRERQQESGKSRYWLSAGSMIALARVGSDVWQTHERKLKPHLYSWLKKSTRAMFLCGPCVLITQMLYQCGRILHNMRDDIRLHMLLNEVFIALSISVTNVQKRWLSLFNLKAVNLQNIGRIKQAVNMLEQITEIYRKSLTEDHPDRLASQHALAGAYEANGQVREAVALLKKVVKIKKQSLAEDHPDRLTSQHALAGAYEANGQVREAVALLEQVVKIREQSLAEDHPSRLTSQHALAGAYKANGQVKEAVALLKQVVKIREQSLAEDHPSRLASQHNLSVYVWELGKHKIAL